VIEELSDLNVVVVGAGRSGRDLHMASYNVIPRTKIVAICDPDENHASIVAGDFNVSHYYSKLEDALNKHDVDIVSICSPPQYHLQQIKMAMEAGANVLTEKPMVVTKEEAEQVNKLVSSNRSKFSVVHNQHFEKHMILIADLLRQKQLGSVLSIDITHRRNGHLDRMIKDPGCWVHQLPGGRWEEMLPHDLYFAYRIFGKMNLVSAAIRKDRNSPWPYLISEDAVVTFQGERGFLNISFFASIEEKMGKKIILHGTKNGLIMDQNDLAINYGYIDLNKKILESRKPVGRRLRKAYEKTKRLLPEEIKNSIKGYLRKQGSELSVNAAHYRIIKQFVDHVAGEAETPVSWDEAYSTFSSACDGGLALQNAVKQRMI
jgi:predicted dehydrogenase